VWIVTDTGAWFLNVYDVALVDQERIGVFLQTWLNWFKSRPTLKLCAPVM